MEATPSLACANKCVFCWRHHTNPVGKSWQWKMDDPIEIVNTAVDLHTKMIKQMKGVPGEYSIFVLLDFFILELLVLPLTNRSHPVMVKKRKAVKLSNNPFFTSTSTGLTWCDPYLEVRDMLL